MGATEPNNPDNRLEGWKSIAAFFGRTERAVQAWEQDGLKIHRFRGRVWAYVEDMEEYRQSRAITPGVFETAESTGAADDVVIGGEPPPATVVSGQGSARLRRHLFGAIGGLLLLTGMWLVLPGPEPVTCQLSGDALVAYDGGGKEAWRFFYPKGFHTFRYSSPDLLAGSCVIGDLDGDARRDLFFVYNSPRADAENSLLYAFASPRNWNRIFGPRVLGVFEPGHKRVISASTGDVYESPYIMQPSTITVLRREHGQNRLLVVSVHNQGAATQVAVLDHRLALVSEYWHPGHLNHVTTEDLFHDGRPRVLLGGVNNGEHSGTLLVFDPEEISGTPKNLSDDRFTLTSFGEEQGNQTPFGPGTEEIVVTFPRTCVALGKKQPYNRIASLWSDPTKIVVTVAEDQSQGSSDVLLFNFRYDLSLIEVLPQGSFSASYGILEKSGMCPTRLWPAGVDSIARSVKVRHRGR